MEFNNITKFVKWLKENLKPEYAKYLQYPSVIDEYLQTLKNDYNGNGNATFELSKIYTKSGCPETISYTVKIEKIDNQFYTKFYF